MEKDFPETACHCKLQVTEVRYVDSGNFYEGLWRLRDASDPNSPLQIVGNGQTWNYYNTGTFVPLPTDYLWLTPPDAGCHHFQLFLYPLTGEPVVVYAKVICCENGADCTEENASTITLHEFVHTGESPYNQNFFHFLSCLILPEGEGDCSLVIGNDDN